MSGGLNILERNVRQISCGTNVIHISYENFLPGEYEKRVIFGSRCRSLVKMRCIFDEKRADIFYMIFGLTSLEDYLKKQPDDIQKVLEILLDIIKAVRDCSSCLIPAEELMLDFDSIYVSEQQDRVLLIYNPGGGRSGSLSGSISAIADRMKKSCRAACLGGRVLDQYQKQLLSCEEDVEKIISATEEAMRRSYTGIPAGYSAPETGPADIHAVMESENAYGAGSIIRQHIRDFFNELVS